MLWPCRRMYLWNIRSAQSKNSASHEIFRATGGENVIRMKTELPLVQELWKSARACAAITNSKCCFIFQCIDCTLVELHHLDWLRYTRCSESWGYLWWHIIQVKYPRKRQQSCPLGKLSFNSSGEEFEEHLIAGTGETGWGNQVFSSLLQDAIAEEIL